MALHDHAIKSSSPFQLFDASYDVALARSSTAMFIDLLLACCLANATCCNEIRGVNYRQMVSDVVHKDLVPVRWNDMR